MLSGSIVDRNIASLCRAGLLMIAGDWDTSHRIVQELDSSEARYWHGILHRREPDTSNALYWFRRIPNHPIFSILANLLLKDERASNTAYFRVLQAGKWNPQEFADRCQAFRDGTFSGTSEEDLQTLQYHECLQLLDYCRVRALRSDR